MQPANGTGSTSRRTLYNLFIHLYLLTIKALVSNRTSIFGPRKSSANAEQEGCCPVDAERQQVEVPQSQIRKTAISVMSIPYSGPSARCLSCPGLCMRPPGHGAVLLCLALLWGGACIPVNDALKASHKVSPECRQGEAGQRAGRRSSYGRISWRHTPRPESSNVSTQITRSNSSPECYSHLASLIVLPRLGMSHAVVCGPVCGQRWMA